MVRYTPATITHQAQYEEELKTVRKNGFAFDDEEYISGVRAVAASVKRYGAYTPAIWVVGFKASMTRKKMQDIVEQTRAAAEKISMKLSNQP